MRSLLSSGGKESPGFMRNQVYANLGAPSRELKVGPGVGLDNAVISLGEGRDMIVTTDPISVIPPLGIELSAWLSVHLVASDFASSGVDPEFAIFTYNFPSAMKKAERGRYVAAVGSECRKLGITIAAGHTGSYPGGGFTVIGSGVMLGRCLEGRYVTPAMAEVGDRIFMTGRAGIEATATLATSFPDFLEKRLGSKAVRRAAAMAKYCSTVRAARAARGAGLGGGAVTSMHDATEGGVMGALGEAAYAAKKMFVANPEKIPVAPETRSVCDAFGIDPLRTMGEGALMITCGPEKIPELREAMRRSRIQVAEIGRVEKGSGLWEERSGRVRRVQLQARDRFWAAYARATRLGLR